MSSAETRMHQARGYKAALSNPNVSQEAKEHAQKVLNEDLNEENIRIQEEGKDPDNVAAGLKSAMHNPRVSEGSKSEAEERLERMGRE